MNETKKLKAILANQIEHMDKFNEERVALFAGFDAIKAVDKLSDVKALTEMAIEELKREKSKHNTRSEKAKKEADKLEKDYQDRAIEAEELSGKAIKEVEDRIAGMVEAGDQDVKKLEGRNKSLNEQIKEKGAALDAVTAELVQASGELDDIRSRLRSI